MKMDFNKWVNDLYEVRMEPDKLIIMITNMHYKINRKPNIGDWVAYKMKGYKEWKIIEWGEGWNEEINGGFIESYRVLN